MAALKDEYLPVLSEVVDCLRTSLDQIGLPSLNPEQVAEWLQRITAEDVHSVWQPIRGSHVHSSKRRYENRKSQNGKVTIRVPYGTFTGELLDVSPGGFRMRHTGPALKPGTEAKVDYNGLEATASVAWSGQSTDTCDMGFVLARPQLF